MSKIDKRKGVKPSATLAKQVSRLFTKYTTREITVVVGIDYLTLKKIERRECVMAHKITELENFINNQNNAA